MALRLGRGDISEMIDAIGSEELAKLAAAIEIEDDNQWFHTAKVIVEIVRAVMCTIPGADVSQLPTLETYLPPWLKKKKKSRKASSDEPLTDWMQRMAGVK